MTQYGPPKQPARAARMLWPSCPWHGGQVQASTEGWMYCKNYGWHLTSGLWDEAKNAQQG